MENASKALIIAGAILLSIVLIGLGVAILGVGQDAMEGVNMDEQKIAAYNAKFLSYEGKQKGSKLKTLCDTIRNHNITNSEDPTQQVALVKSSAAGPAESAVTEDTTNKKTSDINTVKNGLKSATTYNVSISYDPDSGLITLITIY